MAKLLFNKQNKIKTPTLILENKNFEQIGIITNASDLSCRIDFNGADEFTFTVRKEADGRTCLLWDEISDFKVLHIPELKERFEITVSLSQETEPYKTVTATGLCEAELSQLTIRSLEVNTESDISMPDYSPTVFYNESDPKHSLLHRILADKAPHYNIGHVDDSLMHMQRTFSFSGSDIYSILTGEIAEEFDCVFFFDSYERSIHAYDLLDSCQNPDCDYQKPNHVRYPYRGEFDICPYCGESKLIQKGYGKDTSVFISNENLAAQISLETNADSIKNCFYVEGGDEIINAALAMINPNGTSYIYSFYENTLKDMPEELTAKMKSYDEEYRDYNTTHLFEIEDQDALNDYNSLTGRINTLFQYREFDEDGSKNSDWFEPLPENGVLTGYPSVVRAIYNAIDLYGFVKDAMLPTVDINGMDIDSSIAAIISGFQKGFLSEDGKTYFRNTIAVADASQTYESFAERAVERTAKLFFSTAYYSIKTVTESYPDSHKSWTGYFILTSRTQKDADGNQEQRQSRSVTLNILNGKDDKGSAVPNHYALYVQLAIRHEISDSDSLKSKQISDFDLPDEEFERQLQYYSYSELENLLSEFQSCIDMVTNLPNDSILAELHKKYYDFYYSRYRLIGKEIEARQNDLDTIEKMYVCNFHADDTPDSENSPDSAVRGYLYDFQDAATAHLNFRDYIGEESYRLFCSYRREDSYSNSNYISDGLTNAEIIQRAQELLETAGRELYTASHPQYSITASMNNLLELPEFEPLKNDFETGNFIRMEIDGKIYRLRLLSYSVCFDELQNIDVEFSTVKATVNGTSDIESVLSSASSMAGSYDSVKKQMTVANKSAKYIDNWVQHGLNATNVTYTNSDNQEALIDQHGILLREYDPISQEYSPYQAKFLSNGLYITTEHWKTIQAGLGRYTYYDLDKKKFEEGYGLIASTVMGKLVIGENLKIYNENSSVIIDKNGITLDGGKIFWKNPVRPCDVGGLVDFQKNLGGCLGLGADPTTITADSVISPKIGGGYAYWTNGQYSIEIDPNHQASATHSNYLFCISENNNNNVLMSVDTKGNAFFKGQIDTRNGKIGGFTIGNNSIYNGTNSMSSTVAGVYLGTDGIRQYKSANAFVNIQNGVLTAQGAVIKGAIQATSFKMVANPFYNTEKTFDLFTFSSSTESNVLKMKDWNGNIILSHDTENGTSIVSHYSNNIQCSTLTVNGSTTLTGNCYFSTGESYFIKSSGIAHFNTVFSGEKTSYNDGKLGGELTSNGGLILCGNSKNDPRVLFYYNGSTSPTSAITETSAGNISVSGNLKADHMYSKLYTNTTEENTNKHHVICTFPGNDLRGCNYINTNAPALSENSENYYISVNGEWGVGTLKPSAEKNSETHNIISASSDIRLKENISDATEYALDTIMKIQMRQFDWIRSGTHQKIGFVADELEEIDSHFAYGGGFNKDGSMNIKSVDTFYMQGYIVKGIQELASWKSEKEKHDTRQQIEITNLKEENENLKSQIAFLTEQMEAVMRK